MPSDPRPLPRAAALEADLAVTRARLDRDLSALRGKLTPAGLAAEAGARLRGHRSDDRNSGQGAALGAIGQGSEPWRSVARDRPVLTLVGAGLAWLLLRSSRQSKEV